MTVKYVDKKGMAQARLKALKLKIKAQEKKVKALDKIQMAQGKKVSQFSDASAKMENAQSNTLEKLQVESDKLDSLYDQLKTALNPPAIPDLQAATVE